MNCPHRDTLPVELVQPTGTVETVAHLCLTCDQQLPANWGYSDCTWDAIETRTLCNPEPDTTDVCTRRCTTHQEAHP